MALDPQVQGLLDMFAGMQTPDFADQSVEENRALLMSFIDLEGEAQDVAEVRDLIAPGPDGNEIPLRVYRPSTAEDLPVLLYFHGGGFVLGDLEVTDKPCRQLANVANAVVVSVDYRLAPEHKAPAAAEDCYAATAWVAANSAAVGGDTSRLGVSGDSAGGNLSAVLTLMTRDRGGPRIAVQLLIYPALDAVGEYPSLVENGEGYLLTARSMDWFFQHYLDKPADAQSVYVSPMLADDLTGLPPAAVVTAGYDPLRDQGDAYAARLSAAGVPVLHLPNPTMIHGFMWMSGVVSHTAGVYEQLGAFAREHL